jgi:hypothetical protein
LNTRKRVQAGFFEANVFANLEAIDRRTAAVLIKCIRIIGKREIEIEFNYQGRKIRATKQMDTRNSGFVGPIVPYGYFNVKCPL